MIADQNFNDICFTFFILQLWLRPMAKGRSLSGPNIRLRPKVKIAPTDGLGRPKPKIDFILLNKSNDYYQTHSLRTHLLFVSFASTTEINLVSIWLNS